MNQPTKPGQRCLVIGGRMAFNGEGQGPNQGKEVITVFLHPERAGIEQENVWRCKAASGHVLQTYYGDGDTADFLECWLQTIDTPPTPEQIEADSIAADLYYNDLKNSGGLLRRQIDEEINYSNNIAVQ